MEELNELCQCGVSSDNIDGALFHCFEPSSFYVTYRARLTRTDSRTLVSYLEDWVSGGPIIPVQSILMTIDSNCLVAIDGFGEGECDKTSESQSSTSTDNTAATIIGLTIVIVVLLVIVAVLIFALALLWRSHHKKLYKSEK